MASDDRVQSLEITIRKALASQESTIGSLKTDLKSLKADLKEIRRVLTLLVALEMKAHYDRPFDEVLEAVVGYALDGKRPNVTGWSFR